MLCALCCFEHYMAVRELWLCVCFSGFFVSSVSALVVWQAFVEAWVKPYVADVCVFDYEAQQ